MSKAFERLIDKYAERQEFDRLTTYHSTRAALLKSIGDGTYDKMPPEPEIQPLMDEIAREIAYLETALLKRP
ncbi:MAG: hypothetical protein JWR89_4702 [Tardiphaga sp.]|jgi:hypothetical protein|uniref:hypothetical protein n=1 Tax=Tardiphaga sp. TaxID=1926292 RepID=UPI00261A82E2|nr:hypothetical protein [Tardiphaga sp.]MDB5504800.1 hypothetical protein [Tardiphaga sp.]